MTREEFESILEAAFNAGYEDAEIDIMNETKATNKAAHLAITNKEMKKGRFSPISFTDPKDNEDNKKSMKAITTGWLDLKGNPNMVARRDDKGKIKNVRNAVYIEPSQNRLKNDLYLDRTDVIGATNKWLKNIKDPNVRKEKIKKATEIFKKLHNTRKSLE